MLRTLIAIAGICSIVAIVAIVMFAPGNSTELKVALATAAIGSVSAAIGYAYGILAKENREKVNKQ